MQIKAYKCVVQFEDVSYCKIHSAPSIQVIFYPTSEAATEGVLQKQMFLKTSQNSQENTCSRVSFLIKLQPEAWTFI